MSMTVAKLRTCASCEWIFSGGVECPKCQFGSYGAHFVYGKACYRYSLTQKPWLDKKLHKYELKCREEIAASNRNTSNPRTTPWLEFKKKK